MANIQYEQLIAEMEKCPEFQEEQKRIKKQKEAGLFSPSFTIIIANKLRLSTGC
jgi:hypothetical protein